MRLPACFTLLALGAMHAGAMAQTSPPSLIDEIGIDQRLDMPIPSELEFRDAEGVAVRFHELLRERPVLLVPVYYRCPMLCGDTLRGLIGALKAIPLEVGKDFDVVVASFDPSETPMQAAHKRAEILADYGNRGVSSGWRFLSGSELSVKSLTKAIGFRYAYDPASGQFAHASVAVVLTPGGKISRYFFGIDYAPRELRLALVEASRGEIGGVVDQAILYCFRYDPASGRYGVAIMDVLKLGGVATMALIGGFILWSLRQDRLRERPGASPIPTHEGSGVV